jgi:integrase
MPVVCPLQHFSAAWCVESARQGGNHSMSEAKNKRERGTGSFYRPKHSRFWWVKYSRNGTVYRESTRQTDEHKARKFLQKRLGEIATGSFFGPAVEKIQVAELAQDMFRDYRINVRRSLGLTERRWHKHLKPVFGALRASEVTTEVLNKYVDMRKGEGSQNGTINRELAALKRMFSLAYRSTPRKAYQVPAFPQLRENPPRKGFVEQKQYRQLCNECSKLWLRTALALGYNFGFRSAELLNMRVDQVDLMNHSIRLDPGGTKNGEGRIVKLTSETYELVKQSMFSKSPGDFLISRRDGQPVKDFRAAWKKLAEAAKLPGMLFHDLRRSAVRNMVRRGVPEVVAMRISGHKTRSVFDRYNIVNEADLVEAAKRIEEGIGREFGHTSGTFEQIDTQATQLGTTKLEKSM